MPATSAALIQQVIGSTVSNVQSGGWPDYNGQHLDLLQIIQAAGGSILVNVDYKGTVHNPASNATNGTRVGQFETRLSSAASLANIFADAFTNPSNLDILQVVLPTRVIYFLNSVGVATGADS